MSEIVRARNYRKTAAMERELVEFLKRNPRATIARYKGRELLVERYANADTPLLASHPTAKEKSDG